MRETWFLSFPKSSLDLLGQTEGYSSAKALECSIWGFILEWTKEGIRDLRLRLGWTQSDLARRLELNQREVLSWESGLGEPPEAARQQLEFLLRQASFCSDEMKAIPVLEKFCDENAAAQEKLGAS